MEDIEDTKHFDKEDLPDVVPLYSGENSSNDEGDYYILKK